MNVQPLQPTETKVSKQEKDLQRFGLFGLGFSLVALFILWPLGLVGIGCGIRTIMLSYDPAVKRKQTGLRYRVIGIAAVVIGLIDIAGGLAAQ